MAGSERETLKSEVGQAFEPDSDRSDRFDRSVPPSDPTGRQARKPDLRGPLVVRHPLAADPLQPTLHRPLGAVELVGDLAVSVTLQPPEGDLAQIGVGQGRQATLQRLVEQGRFRGRRADRRPSARAPSEPTPSRRGPPGSVRGRRRVGPAPCFLAAFRALRSVIVTSSFQSASRPARSNSPRCCRRQKLLYMLWSTSSSSSRRRMRLFRLLRASSSRSWKYRRQISRAATSRSAASPERRSWISRVTEPSCTIITCSPRSDERRRISIGRTRPPPDSINTPPANPTAAVRFFDTSRRTRPPARMSPLNDARETTWISARAGRPADRRSAGLARPARAGPLRSTRSGLGPWPVDPAAPSACIVAEAASKRPGAFEDAQDAHSQRWASWASSKRTRRRRAHAS